MDDQDGELPVSVLRGRTRGHEAASLYIPPPMRMKSSEPVTRDPAAELTNKVPTRKELPPKASSIRAMLLKDLCSPSPQPKKCENSYMLFDTASPKAQSVNNSANQKIYSGKLTKSDQNGFDSNECPRKRISQIKKCDNSYLLFSEKLHPEDNDSSITNGRKLDRIAKGSRLKEQKAASANHLPSLCQSEKDEFQVRESRNYPPVMDDISLQLGAFKVTKPSLMYPQSTESPERLFRNDAYSRPVSSSQKKCHNSSLLFDVQAKSEPKSQPSRTFIKSDEILRYIPITNGISTDDREEKSIISNRKRPPTDVKDGCLSESCKDNSKISIIEDKPVNNKPVESSLPSGLDMYESIDDYVVEFYEFPVSFKTQDFMSLFSSYVQDGFFVKWVDDSHALGVFSNPFSVTEVLKKTYTLLKVRVLQEALDKSQEIASTIPIPNASRPRTCPSLARRLVSGALGLRVAVPDSVRQAEKKMLQDAKAERKLAAKQREEAWEGTLKSSISKGPQN